MARVTYDQLGESSNQTNVNSTQPGFREMIEASNDFLSETFDKMVNLYRYMFGEEFEQHPVPQANCVMDDLGRLAMCSEELRTLINKFIARIDPNLG